MNKNSKIFIAGHLGMVGSACMRLLKQEGYTNVICKTRSELDLTKQEQVDAFFKIEKPDIGFSRTYEFSRKILALLTLIPCRTDTQYPGTTIGTR